MPPRVKITKEDIINTGVKLVRECGEEAINARTIASSLNCSTQPIFSNFSSMEELKEAVRLSAYGIYLDFIAKETECGKYPRYKAFGMAYIRFARDEKELFKLLFMYDRKGKPVTPTYDFEESIRMISSANGISYEKAQLFHTEMWTCVHGIATMFVTSFISLEWELIENMLTDVYQGLRARHTTEV